MKKNKITQFFVLNSQQKAGFTLIELLLVIAIIAIMSTMILMMLDSGREKAELNRYRSYAVQMQRLVADSVAAGQFDSRKIGITGGNDMYCLGEPDYDCGKTKLEATGTSDAAKIYKALTYLTEMPKTTKDNAFSPYNKSQGVFMAYKPGGENVVGVYMYLLSTDKIYLQKVCKSMKWGYDPSGYCYIDIPLHSRL